MIFRPIDGCRPGFGKWRSRDGGLVHDEIVLFLKRVVCDCDFGHDDAHSHYFFLIDGAVKVSHSPPGSWSAIVL